MSHFSPSLTSRRIWNCSGAKEKDCNLIQGGLATSESCPVASGRRGQYLAFTFRIPDHTTS
jgi:hypothetical protein